MAREVVTACGTLADISNAPATRAAPIDNVMPVKIPQKAQGLIQQVRFHI